MGIINSWIEHLQNSMSKRLRSFRDTKYIDISKLTSEERKKAFITLGEGSENLTKLLKTAYEHNVESVYCCSGHGGTTGYVMFRVTNKNLEYLQNVGKALSHYGVETEFKNHNLNGKFVVFHSYYSQLSENWFGIANNIMENLQNFNYENPTILYNKEIKKIIDIPYEPTPFGYHVQKTLLTILKSLEPKNKLLPEAKLNCSNRKKENFDNSLHVDVENNPIVQKSTEDKKDKSITQDNMKE